MGEKGDGKAVYCTGRPGVFNSVVNKFQVDKNILLVNNGALHPYSLFRPRLSPASRRGAHDDGLLY